MHPSEHPVSQWSPRGWSLCPNRMPWGTRLWAPRMTEPCPARGGSGWNCGTGLPEGHGTAWRPTSFLLALYWPFKGSKQFIRARGLFIEKKGKRKIPRGFWSVTSRHGQTAAQSPLDLVSNYSFACLHLGKQKDRNWIIFVRDQNLLTNALNLPWASAV